MEAVCDVESCQDVVETVASHILGVEDNDAEEVANQPKTSNCFKRFKIVHFTANLKSLFISIAISLS